MDEGIVSTLITVQEQKRDVNGNRRWLYIFYLDGENVSREFKHYGRAVHRGIVSQQDREHMHEWLSSFGSAICYSTSGKEACKLSKRISRCNSYTTCAGCTKTQGKDCMMLERYEELLNNINSLKPLFTTEIMEA